MYYFLRQIDLFFLTDKAVVALEVDDDGTLAKIIKSADSGTIQIGSLIAMLAEEGEDWKEINAKGAIDESGSSGIFYKKKYCFLREINF